MKIAVGNSRMDKKWKNRQYVEENLSGKQKYIMGINILMMRIYRQW